MPPSRSLVAAIATTSSIVLFGTVYSVINDTYLDTSNPLLTSLPHHLHATDYFASKKNPFNVYFVKKLWAWITAAFLFHFITSSPAARTRIRFAQFALATSVWLAFTSWFFGPSVLDRLIVSTGGECTLHLPSGAAVVVPAEYCVTRTRLSPETHPALFPASLLLPADGAWKGTPRLRKGHDVSGHIFLLTLAALFLVDQLRASSRGPPPWSRPHVLAVVFAWAVTFACMFMMYTTSVYFHTPFEKLTGYGELLVCGCMNASNLVCASSWACKLRSHPATALLWSRIHFAYHAFIQEARHHEIFMTREIFTPAPTEQRVD